MTNWLTIPGLALMSVFKTSGDAVSPTNQPAPAISGPTITTPQGHVPSSVRSVMAIPELVSEILSWLSDEYVEYWTPASGDREPVRKRYYTLSRCGRVNRLWFREAMRHLWADASKAPTFSLPHSMGKIEPKRRQMYANLIVSANFIDVEKKNVKSNNSSLRGVTFPRLKRLHLILDMKRQTVCMPRLRAPVLDEVHLHLGIVTKQDFPPELWVTLDPREMNQICRRHPFLRRRSARKIAGQMKEQFSATKTLILNGRRLGVADASLKYFSDRMPGLVIERVRSN